MVCAMLGCGEAKLFKDFKTTFTHKNGTQWFFHCLDKHKILWECEEIPITRSANMHLCDASKAAGVICNCK